MSLYDTNIIKMMVVSHEAKKKQHVNMQAYTTSYLHGWQV